jgi:hypothetical protein
MGIKRDETRVASALRNHSQPYGTCQPIYVAITADTRLPGSHRERGVA